MTLEEALRKHLGCEHELLLEQLGDTVLAMHRDSGEVSTVSAPGVGEGAAAGSAMFHALSNGLIDLPGHTRTPMHITDEEYAGFVA